MPNSLARHVRRVAAADPIAAGGRYDYADAFALRLPAPDPTPCPPEAWVRAGLDATPAAVDRVVGVLGFREEPDPPPDRLSVVRIVASGPAVVHLEATVPLMRVVMVGRNPEPGRRMLATAIRFDRPLLARLSWALVGIGRGWAAPKLLAAVAAPAQPRGEPAR